MLKNYFKIAWRKLIAQKSTSLINIFGLAIGVSSCLIIYLITQFEFGFDTFHQDKERIYRVVSIINNPDGVTNYIPQVPFAAAWNIQQKFSGIEKIASFFGYSAKVAIPDSNKPTRKFEARNSTETIIAEPAYFSIFNYEWLKGNAATALNQPFHVVLTESRAHLYFGSMPLEEIIGRRMVYNDSLPVTVSGIVKDWQRPSDLIFKEFISFSTIQTSFLKEDGDLQFATRPDRWGRPESIQTFVELTKGTTISHFEVQTRSMVNDHMTHKEDPGHLKLTLQPLSTLHFDTNYEDFYSGKTHLQTLYILMGIALFILLIAAVNFINLSTAQSLNRAKEIGIRKVLGSDRISIALQFFTETFLIICVAMLLSLPIVYIVLHLFGSLIPNGPDLGLTNAYTWIFLSGMIFFTSLLAGFYPAIVLSSYSPTRSLQARKMGDRKAYFRNGLTIFQFTISLVLTTGAICVGRQSHYLLGKDMGFTKDAILGIETSPNYPTEKRNILAERIRRLTGVSMVSACESAPITDYNQSEENPLQIPGRPEKVECSVRVGDEYYIPLFGIKIIAGRNFIPLHDDTAGLIPANANILLPPKHTEIVINETCARQLGFKTPADAVGTLVTTPPYAYPALSGPVVGVVADFNAHHYSLR